MNNLSRSRLLDPYGGDDAPDRKPEHWADAMIRERREQIEEALKIVDVATDFDRWPKDWSTEMTLSMALVLDRHDVLFDMGYTMLEAMDRVHSMFAADLLRIQTKAQKEGSLHNWDHSSESHP